MFRNIITFALKPIKAVLLLLLKTRIGDRLLLILVVPAAFVLREYRRYGSNNLPITTKFLKKMGIFPIVRHYYEPLFDNEHLRGTLSKERILPGIDLNVDGQISFLEKLQYRQELLELNLCSKSENIDSFYIKNGNFECGDAEYLYQLIRFIKPNKVMEIGSGHSTKIARLALDKNYNETHKKAAHICIEPYEMNWLEQLKGVDVIRKRIEDCEFTWRTELSAGDLLFIDSSHVIRPQGDVLREFLEILPELASGVYVHIHDILTPRDYVQSWVIDFVWLWNEQYLVEALISDTNRYEIVGALNYLKNSHYEALHSVCPYLSKDSEPTSFYLKVI